MVIASSPYVTNEKLIANLTQEVQILKNSIEIQEKQYLNEIHSSSTGAGYGPIAKELSNRLEDSKEMLLEKSHKLITLNLKRDSLERLANHPNEADYSFISKIEALCKIASFKNNESTSLPIVNLLICIFVILICLMPIINKMMMSDGVYDILIKREGELIERITRLHIVELKKKLNN